MSTPDMKIVNDTIATICDTHGIMVQNRVTGTGTVTRYVDRPGRVTDREAAARDMKTAAEEMRKTGKGAEAMMFTMASEIVTKVRPSKKAAK